MIFTEAPALMYCGLANCLLTRLFWHPTLYSSMWRQIAWRTIEESIFTSDSASPSKVYSGLQRPETLSGCGERTLCPNSRTSQGRWRIPHGYKLTYPSLKGKTTNCLTGLVCDSSMGRTNPSRVTYQSKDDSYLEVSQVILVPKNGWFIMENPWQKWMI
jgi:hypothetical protein